MVPRFRTDESGVRGERASLPGLPLPVFFTIRATSTFSFYEKALFQQVS
jgi:hypothetical protein